jgi:hypothetical protein
MTRPKSFSLQGFFGTTSTEVIVGVILGGILDLDSTPSCFPQERFIIRKYEMQRTPVFLIRGPN